MQNTPASNSEVSEQQIFLEQEIPWVNIDNSEWTKIANINWANFITTEWWEEIQLTTKIYDIKKYGNKIVVMTKTKGGEKVPPIYACDDYLANKTFKCVSWDIVSTPENTEKQIVSKLSPTWDVFISETKRNSHEGGVVKINWTNYTYNGETEKEEIPPFMTSWFGTLVYEDIIYAVLWSGLNKYIINQNDKSILLLKEEKGDFNVLDIGNYQIILWFKDGKSEKIYDLQGKKEWKNPISREYPVKYIWGKIYAIGDDGKLYCDDKKINYSFPKNSDGKALKIHDFSVARNQLIYSAQVGTNERQVIKVDLSSWEEVVLREGLFPQDVAIDGNGNYSFTENKKWNNEWNNVLTINKFETSLWKGVWRILKFTIDWLTVDIEYEEKQTSEKKHKKISLNEKAKEVVVQQETEKKEKAERQEILELTQKLTPEQLKQIIADAERLQWLETKLQTVSVEKDEANLKVGELELQVGSLKERIQELEKTQNVAIGGVNALVNGLGIENKKKWLFGWEKKTVEINIDLVSSIIAVLKKQIKWEK